MYNTHEANRYGRAEDQLGRTYVLVPESEFIQHCREAVDYGGKADRIQSRFLEIQDKYHKLKLEFNEAIRLQIDKARIQQRQEDAKVYAHWRDKCKKLEKDNAYLTGALRDAAQSAHRLYENIKAFLGIARKVAIINMTDESTELSCKQPNSTN